MIPGIPVFKAVVFVNHIGCSIIMKIAGEFTTQRQITKFNCNCILTVFTYLHTGRSADRNEICRDGYSIIGSLLYFRKI